MWRFNMLNADFEVSAGSMLCLEQHFDPKEAKESFQSSVAMRTTGVCDICAWSHEEVLMIENKIPLHPIPLEMSICRAGVP